MSMFDKGTNENMPLASASIKNTTGEVGFGLLSADSAYHRGIAGDYHSNNTPIPLPVIPVPPFPNWNVNGTSKCYGKEIGPTGGTSMIDSSHFKSAQNIQMDHYYPHQRQEPKPLPCIPDSGFPFPQGYTGWPYPYTRHEHDNQTIPDDDVINAAFNLNSFENLPNGGKCVTPSYGSVGRPQMVNPSGTTMSDNTGQPLLNMNFGMTIFNPNRGGAESLLTSGKFDERFMAVSSGTNRVSKSNTVIPRINVTGNSERMRCPPVNTYHNQLGKRSFSNPRLDMNSAFSGLPNNDEVISDLSHAANHEVLFDSRPGLGPSYAFQKPAAGDQNQYLRQGFGRCKALPSLPHVGSQIMPFDNGQNRVNGQVVPCSIGMVTAQSPCVILPENSGKLSSPSFASPSLVMARSTRRHDSSNSCPPAAYHGQTQAVGSIQQSNSPLGPYSTPNLGIQNGKGNMTAQSSATASLKRVASQPPSSTFQDQRRKTLPAHPFIHPSIPTWTRVAPSAPNTSQAIPPRVHPAQSLTPQATLSFVPTMFPTNWSKSALSAPSTAKSQTIRPVMQTAPFLPPHDKRVSSLQPSSHIPSPQNQQLLAQALAHQRLKGPPIIAHIKYKDETPEPIGHRCFLCKRDLSYSPEGPISQPLARPAAAVLSCGHTFHEYCLERITPDDQSKVPPCIPCALCE